MFQMKWCRMLAVSGTAAAVLVSSVGCEQLPGSDEAQGATIGGLSGAAAGAVIGGEDNRAMGAILGGLLGAGGGYVIGANRDRIFGDDREGAKKAVERAQENPATVEEARNATTADLNNDGFVTLDEVVAMQNAGITEQEMVRRLRETGQIFDLTQEQQEYLRDSGVSESVISQLPDLNRGTITPTGRDTGVISSPQQSDPYLR